MSATNNLNVNIQEGYKDFLEELGMLQKRQNEIIAAYRQKLEQQKLALIQKKLVASN